MKTTRAILLTLSILLVFALAACGAADSSPAPADGGALAADTSADTAQPTEEPPSGAVISEAAGNCNNAFYPLRNDTVWTYQIVNPVEEKPTGSFNLSYGNISGDSFDALMSLKNAETEEIFQAASTWYCSGEGMLSSDFATLNFASNLDVKVETLDYAGISLLPADQWELGKTWDTSYKVNVTFSVEGMDIVSAMDIQIVNTISAIEEVSVTAGTYPEAYRVDTTGTMTVDMEGDMDFSMGNLPIEYTTWFVRDVGMVKQITTGPDADGTYTELVSVE
jgi:hypothetical protein